MNMALNKELSGKNIVAKLVLISLSVRWRNIIKWPQGPFIF